MLRSIRRIRDLDIEPARYLNIGLAGWLLLSVFLWRHSEPQFLVTVFVGAVVAFVSPFELGSPLVRRTNMAAGAGLALAALALPHASSLTMWHNALIGLVIAGLAFFGPPHGTVPPRPPAPDDAYEGVGMAGRAP